MNTHYRNNLEAVMQVNKNYTDTEIKKSEERMKWYIGEYQTTTQDDNTTAYQKTVPSGATRVKIKRIYGNTIKYNPSVASDTTVAFMKTLPDTVYTLDVSYVYGTSEVSENLIVLQDVAETTTNGITYSVSNGVLTYSGTPTARTTIELSFPNRIDINHAFYFKLFNAVGYGWSVQQGALYLDEQWVTVTFGSDYYTNINNIENTRSTFTKIRFILIEGNTFNNTCKPMLVSGTTAPTEFKEGYTGIHNLELNGIKSEGRNLANLGNVAQTTTTGVTYKCENGAVTMGADATGNTRVFIPLETPLPAGTYSYNQFTKLNGHNAYLSDDNNATNIQLLLSSGTTNSTATITTDRTMNYLYYYTPNGSQYNSYTFTPMIVRGDTVPTEYQPYIAPTTIPIDLTSIEDSGGNKLFADGSLKGVGNVADEITPYKAIKRMGIVDLSTLTWNNYNSDTTGYSKYANAPSDMKVGNDTYVINGLTPNYEIVGFNSINQWTAKDKVLCGVDNAKRIIIRDTSGITPSGYLVYELATPIEVSIDWSATLRNIQGYSKGTITLQNTYNMDTANTITYNSIIKEVLNTGVRLDGANIYSGVSTYTGIMNNTYANSIDLGNLPKGTYTISFNVIANVGNRTFVIYTYSNGSIVDSIVSSVSGTGAKNYTFTLSTSNYDDVRLGLNTGGNDYTIQLENLMLEVGSTAHYYRPYKASQTVNFPTTASDGYSAGSVYNVRDFTTSKRETNVVKEDMGTPAWTYSSTNQKFSTDTGGIGNKGNTTNMLCRDYTTINPTYGSQSVADKTIGTHNSGPQIIVKDLRYDNATIFKTANAGNPLYYELADASKTESNIEAINNILVVEEGDVLTFLNSENLPVPSDITYRIEVARV